eukprot:7385628-Prymnesium_polylepis.2
MLPFLLSGSPSPVIILPIQSSPTMEKPVMHRTFSFSCEVPFLVFLLGGAALARRLWPGRPARNA